RLRFCKCCVSGSAAKKSGSKAPRNLAIMWNIRFCQACVGGISTPLWGRFSFAKENCPQTPTKERQDAGEGCPSLLLRRIGEVAYSVARAGFSPSSEPAVRLFAQRALHHIFRRFPKLSVVR